MAESPQPASENAPRSAHRETISRRATVPEALSGQRCDQIAAQLFSEFSRGKLQQWIHSAALTVDGAPCKTKQKLLAGMQLSLEAEFEAQSDWQAEDKPLNIVFEDAQVLVLDKAANCVVHPAPGNPSGTLANSVLSHCPDNAELPRGGIVHRLDKDTTGLMVVAKTLAAHRSLVEQLQQRSVSRHYRALVCGQLISGGRIDAAIGRHPNNRTKMAAFPNGAAHAKPAITHYRVAQRFPHHSELNIKLETGRTHQIRVHMAQLRHPLIGDRTYNPRYRRPADISEALNDQLQRFPRQALHAFELSFDHPTAAERCHFQADLPADYCQLLAALEAEEKSARK